MKISHPTSDGYSIGEMFMLAASETEHWQRDRAIIMRMIDGAIAEANDDDSFPSDLLKMLRGIKKGFSIRGNQ